MNMNIKKTIYKGLIIFFLGIIIGLLLNIASFIIPNKTIHQNVKNSVSAFERDPFFQIIDGYETSIVDLNTDAWMLLLADDIGNENKSILEKAVEGAYKIYEPVNDGLVGTSSIKGIDDGLSDAKTGTYSRYWHGWIFPLRLLLTCFEYSSIQMINMLGQLILIVFLIMQMYERGLKKYIFPYVASWFALNPITIMMSLSFSPIFYIYNLALIYMMKYHVYLKQKNYYSLFFLIIGMLTSYVDFLTYPLITLGIPLCFYLILAMEELEHGWKVMLKDIISFSLIWSIGYVLFWTSKWVISSIILDVNIIENAFNDIRLRTGNNVGNIQIGILSPVIANLARINEKPYIMFSVISIIYSIINISKTNRKHGIKKERVISSLLFLIIALYPFVWWVLTANHSYIHIFTYREIAISVFAGLCFFVSMYDVKEKVGLETAIKH